MRRKYLFAALLAGLAAAGGLAYWAAPTTARPANTASKDESDAARKTLPLTQVVLFNSGVGYFQREGSVEGNARIDMTFPVSDVNDLLKSVLLEDLGGGKVSTVSYDSQEPIEHTLKAFALDLTYNPTFGQLINQARGEKVEVTLKDGGNQPAPVTGVIVGMESAMDGPKEVHQLNLLCTEGMRCVPLAQVQRLRFLNANLDAELRTALEVLAGKHDSRKKSVSLSFTGEGKRGVRVGYVVENPLWKASYRLKFDKDNKLTLQSWAVVENTTDEDWKDVRLALVAGRPISFQMDLYQPLFVPRPTVEPELFASLRPPMFNGALISAGNAANLNPVQPGQPAQQGQLGNNFRGLDNNNNDRNFNGYLVQNGASLAGGMNRYQVEGNFNANPMAFGLRSNNRLSYEELQARRQQQQEQKANRDQALKLGSAIAAVDPRELANLSENQESEDSYQYVIDQKVTVPRQKSAMLPVLTQEVTGTRVSIYNERVQNKHPLLGLRFKNTTGQPLMQGPVMVHEGGRYAGDARILDMQPGEERLLGYAVDLGTEVLGVNTQNPERIVSAKVVKGVLNATCTLQKTRTYHIKNRSKQDRVVVVEHPFAAEWKVVSETKPVEISREVYRFEVKVPSGQLVKLDVTEERAQTVTALLNTLDDGTLKLYINSPITGEKMKDALKKIIEERQSIAGLQSEVKAMEERLKVIVEDQGRLRANIERVPHDSEVYKRYLNKFDTQETQIEKLQADLEQKRDTVRAKQKEFENLVIQFNF
jgi:hypothetical protein